MESSTPRTRPARRKDLLVLGVVAIATGLVIAHPWDAWCPTDWSNASRVELGDSSGNVTLDGRAYRVGGGALLDYGLRVLMDPRDYLLYALRGERHPMTVTASISAASPQALGDPAFTCFRVTRGSEVWARRPTTYPTQAMADALPPGAPPPTHNEAWRRAVASDGPEWPTGDQVGLELWLSIEGRRYVFVLPPLTLQGGL